MPSDSVKGWIGLFIFAALYWNCVPLATIYAVNFLFGTAIPINFWTWLAMAWLHWVAKGRVLLESN